MFLAVFYNTYCLLCLFGSKEKSHRYQIVKGILKGHLEIAIVSVVEQLLSHWSKLITILNLGLDSNACYHVKIHVFGFEHSTADYRNNFVPS